MSRVSGHWRCALGEDEPVEGSKGAEPRDRGGEDRTGLDMTGLDSTGHSQSRKAQHDAYEHRQAQENRHTTP